MNRVLLLHVDNTLLRANPKALAAELADAPVHLEQSGSETVVLAYDWVDLYNRIAHGLLFILLRRFCTKAGMAGGLISFLVAAVELFLTENYCHFDSSIWKQTVGFAI